MKGKKDDKKIKVDKLAGLSPVPWNLVDLGKGFWRTRQDVNRRVTLPLQYELNSKNGVFDAYQWDDWDTANGKPPWRIWVGDLGKWIEAASYSLAKYPDDELSRRVDVVVGKILKGQKVDGYIYPNPMPKTWHFRDIRGSHELYEVGHDIEGAVALWQATGKLDFLEGVCRAADLFARTFGTGKGQTRGYDGHPEVELALVKLYRATGKKRYLDLAKFFIDERGQAPLYFIQEDERRKADGIDVFTPPTVQQDYFQAHKPLRDQEDAVGHAVRALYLYSGAADVAAETNDEGLLVSCRRLWRSVTRRRMYITGGVGSTAHGEALTFDYDLPNETAYAETCANIALVFFAHRMLQVEVDSEYADVMEKALYNGVLSGISLDGRRFFYVNPLTFYPQKNRENAASLPALQRNEWFGCACCPPNIARLIASIGQYIYSTTPEGVYVHLYAASSTDFNISGQTVRLTQTTEYPWKETVNLAVSIEAPTRFTLSVRLPGWCRKPQIRVNGKKINLKTVMKKGYAHLCRDWRKGDIVELVFPMPVERMEANPGVRMDCGKIVLQRGPLVYCLEEIDNGRELADISLPRRTEMIAEFHPELLGGCVVLKGIGLRRKREDWKDVLYRASSSTLEDVDIVAVPYALWGNRNYGEMITWIRES